MKILVIGSGGREHAMAWHIAKSPEVKKVFVAPGNAGTATEHKLENLPITDFEALANFCEHEKIHLTVVGPEAPLAAGLVDYFQSRNLRIFGPTQHAAQLESSKQFAKEFMIRHHIPTAHFATFTHAQQAHAYVNQQGAPIVIKADGLAAGKGVVVAETLEQAHQAIDNMLIGNTMGQAGSRVVIEEFLSGEEASFIVMVDGDSALPLASSQDHKRLLDQDQGPNTGGMGAYSPAPVVTPSIHAKIIREVIKPTLMGLKQENIHYCGFLYAGLMISPEGQLKVLEFNCRLGDPETQPILMRLKSDLLTLLNASVNKKLHDTEALWNRRAAVGVVLAAHGYPESPRQGDTIFINTPKGQEDVHVFHAGTSTRDGNLVTQGGRVLCVTALGDSIRIAQQNAYEQVNHIQFDGMQYRKDIGFKALNRPSE